MAQQQPRHFFRGRQSAASARFRLAGSHPTLEQASASTAKCCFACDPVDGTVLVGQRPPTTGEGSLSPSPPGSICSSARGKHTGTRNAGHPGIQEKKPRWVDKKRASERGYGTSFVADLVRNPSRTKGGGGNLFLALSCQRAIIYSGAK